MKFKNIQVFGLESNMVRSGYPHQIGEPDNMYFWDRFNPDPLPENVISRAKKLANTPAGSGHSNFRKGIIVQFDILYTQYFSQQLQRYSFVNIISSQSKMHKLASVKNILLNCNDYVMCSIANEINYLIRIYNNETFPYRYTDTSGEDFTIRDKKECFHYIISNLPMGYQLWMGVSTNYEQLATIYRQRCKHKHKLEDWKEFCEFIKGLPMSKELIIGKND